MSREDVEKMVYGSLDALRSLVLAEAERIGHVDAMLAGWVGTASKKQCLIQLLWMLANQRRAEEPF